MISALKQATVLLQLSEKRFSQLMSFGLGTSSSVTPLLDSLLLSLLTKIKCGTEPMAQAIHTLFLLQAQLREGGRSLLHLHICFNGTAASPGSPIKQREKEGRRAHGDTVLL